MKFTKENIYKMVARYSVDQGYLLGDLKSDISKLDDTPEKVVVPKCFDEWFKEIYERGPIKNARKQFALWKICQFGFGSYLQNVNGEDIKDCELSTWVGNNRMIAINAVLNGYEVEKEPLYVVSIMDLDDDRIILIKNKCDYSFELESDNEGYWKQYFTETEIKNYDERYWPFAVKVSDELIHEE